MGIVLLVLVALMLLGAFPRWNHSRDWGYGPSGGRHEDRISPAISAVMIPGGLGSMIAGKGKSS